MKERIIGAVVLVLVAVLVVPVFLDGPPGEGEVISQSVPLPGQSEQDAQTIVLNRDRDEPVPATGNAGDASTQPQPRPQPVRQEPEPEPEPVVREPAPAQPEESSADVEQAATTPARSSATGMWAVQLGSFGNEENAERLVTELRRQGFAAFRSKVSTSSGELHRVRIGPQKDRESAEDMAARLLKAGHKGQVVPHP